MHQPLRVGFDLDGVILYNPARIFRPVAHVVKKKILKQKGPKKFYIPEKPLEQFIWRVLHLSSIFVAPGFDDIIKLIEEHKVKAYLVTARYAFLKEDLDYWLKKLKLSNYFEAIYYNEKNDQPHLYKEKMLQKLGLDVFVEDNWDIVSHLQTDNMPKVFWIYNVLDRHVPYQYKFPTLKKAVHKIKELTQEKETSQQETAKMGSKI